jgi:ELWxxDGT repeat protein
VCLRARAGLHVTLGVTVDAAMGWEGRTAGLGARRRPAVRAREALASALRACALLACGVLVCGALACGAPQPPGGARRAPPGEAARGALSAAPFVVADLRSEPEAFRDEALTHFFEAGGATFFVGREGHHGAELWRTDGTAEGTRLVRDLAPGPWGSEPQSMAELDGALHFVAAENPWEDRYGLWRSDGTAEGTRPLARLGNRATFLLPVGGVLLFDGAGVESPFGWNLWRSDGTAGGTYPLRALGAASHWVGYARGASLGARAVFVAADAEHGAELWASDGTLAGTGMVRDLLPGKADSDPAGFTRLGAHALFWAQTAEDVWALWRTDGTPEGTGMLRVVQGWANGSGPRALVVSGGAAFFVGYTPEQGMELWRTDGTPEGTRLVADVAPGAASAGPYRMVDVDGTLYFYARHPDSGDELWRTDGTAEGTALVADLVPGAGGSGLSHAPSGAGLGKLFFAAWTPEHGSQLWRADPRTGEVLRLTDWPDRQTYEPFQALHAPRGAGHVYVAHRSGELWRTDGTREGTRPVRALTARGGGSAPRWTVNLFGTLLFAASDGLSGEELWRSDGTAAGTWQVADLQPGAADAFPSRLTVLGGGAYFLTGDWERAWSGGAYGLWRTDGTREGTVQVASLAAGPSQGGPPALVPVGERLFYLHRTWGLGVELWATDGTPEGTARVAGDPLESGPGWSPEHLTGFDGRLFFSARGADFGRSVWVSDGTATGTRRYAALGTAPAAVDRLVAAERQLFVFGSWGEGRLWRSRGATSPLELLGTWPGGTLQEAVAVGDAVFFSVDPYTDGPGLWRSDGGAPVLLRRFGTASSRSRVQGLTAHGGRLYFWADDGAHGLELWRSDGTPEGTVLVRDIAPGLASAVRDAAPMHATREGLLLFAASDGASGLEPWQTDGTEAGTVRLADLHPGPSASAPAWFATSGQHVFFRGTGPAGGPELWAVPSPSGDTAPPQLSCPAPAQAEATSPEGAVVHFAGSAHDAAGPSALRYSPRPGTRFALGETPVEVVALDETGNRATCSFPVRVRDTTPPAVACPGPQEAEATSPGGAPVSFPPPTATDVASTPRVRTSHPAGSVFPLGTTRVTATATDGAGLRATCAFTVRVADTQAPRVACPQEAVLEATGPQGAAAFFALPTAEDAVSTPVVAATPGPGSVLPLGTTLVSVDATDGAGNVGRCSFPVHVRDTRPPALTCPPEVAVLAPAGAGGVAVTFEPTATDAVSAVEVRARPASGSAFPLGETPVEVSATDASGNTSDCTFRVRVGQAPAQPPGTGGGQPAQQPAPVPGRGCQQGAAGPATLGLLLLVLGWGRTRRRPLA